MSKKNLSVIETVEPIKESSEVEGDFKDFDFEQEGMFFYEVLCGSRCWLFQGHKFNSQSNWDRQSLKALDEFKDVISNIKDKKLASKVLSAALSFSNVRSRDIFIKTCAWMGSNLNSAQTIDGLKAFEKRMEGFSEKL